MLTAHSAQNYLRLLKAAVLMLTCCVVTGEALFGAYMSGAKAAGEGVDPTFIAPLGERSVVSAIAVQPDGKILISHNPIARLNLDGSFDTSFNSVFGGDAQNIVLQPDGKIIIAGGFLNLGRVGRNRIARLNPDGSIDESFNPVVNDFLTDVFVLPDGRILIGGAFTSVGGVACNGTAWLNSDGSLNAPLNLAGNVFTTAMFLQPDGKILVGYIVINVPSMPTVKVARLYPDGTLDTSFNSGLDGDSALVDDFAMQPDGKILVAGRGGLPRDRLTRLHPDGSIDLSFNPVVELIEGQNALGVFDIALQPDGSSIIIGSFDRVNGTVRNNIARVHTNGTLDTSFDPNLNFAASAVALQTDGKILIGGSFNTVGGLQRFGVARLLAPPLLLTSSANPSAVGQSVTFTATVTQPPASPSVPTGTITFSEGAAALATVPLDSNGRAFFSTTLPAGTHVINAFYSGDQSFAPQSAMLPQTIEALALSFSDSEYTINESVGRVDITVLRSADVPDGDVTVDFMTTDGSASSRSDYTTSLGTLTFARGEMSRTFTVFITNDSRIEGDETLTLALSNPTGGFTLIAPSTATLTIRDDDAPPNPINSTEFFVRQHYRDFLNRDPDASGLAFWTNEIEQCGVDPVCREVKRINVSAAFFLCIEFQQTGYRVFRLYRATFPDAPPRPRAMPRMSEFLRDTQEIGRGLVVGAPGWEEQLRQNVADFARRWVVRPEVLTQLPETLTAAQFVDKLFANSGVTPTTAERDEALAAYGAGGTQGRAAALLSVTGSGSVFNKQYNPAFVYMQYAGYLRRHPTETPDTDFTGFDFWLSKLDSFTQPGEDARDETVAIRRAQRAEMVKAFLSSSEYRTRF